MKSIGDTSESALESIKDNGLLVKQFNGQNIEVYGTFDEPLFKAKDIGDLLDIRDIKSTIREEGSKK